MRSLTDKAVVAPPDTPSPNEQRMGSPGLPATASLALALAAFGILAVLFWRADGVSALGLAALTAAAAGLYARLWHTRTVALAARESLRQNALRFQSLSDLSVDW